MICAMGRGREPSLHVLPGCQLRINMVTPVQQLSVYNMFRFSLAKESCVL